MNGACIQDNVVIFLKPVKRVGLHDGIFFVLMENIDLTEIRISLVDIIYADQFVLLADRILFR